MAAAPRHACLPTSALTLLAERAAAPGGVGPGALVDALHEAGRIAGIRLFDALDPAPERLTAKEFWSRAGERMDALGLGLLEPEALGPDLAALTWVGTPETAAPRRGPVGCPLATGLLGGLLSRAAGRPVAVLEVACAAGGANACRFLVGAEPRLREHRRRRLEGVDETTPAGTP